MYADNIERFPPNASQSPLLVELIEGLERAVKMAANAEGTITDARVRVFGSFPEKALGGEVKAPANGQAEHLANVLRDLTLTLERINDGIGHFCNRV